MSFRLAGLALAACATAPSPQAPVLPALERFADACQFVPPGMLSFAFFEEDVMVADAPAGTQPRHALVVRAGRDFEPPPRAGYGKYRGIEIFDCGASLPFLGSNQTNTTIAGLPAWFEPEHTERGYSAPAWSVIVDGRYALGSSDRATLEQALQRTGRLASVAAPFAALGQLDSDAAEVICLLPRPDDKSYWGRPVPVETMVIAVTRASWRCLVFHRVPLPEAFVTALESVADLDKWTMRSLGEWSVEEAVLEEPMRESAGGMLAFDMLFGMSIFI